MARLFKFIITFGITLLASYLVLKVFAYCSFSGGYTVNFADTFACSIIGYIIIGVIRLCTLFDFLNTAYKYPWYISLFKTCWRAEGLYTMTPKEKQLADLLENVARQSDRLAEAENTVRQLEEDLGITKEDDKNGKD